MAHRVELLHQTALTFRRLNPELRFGWYAGQWTDARGDIVFASIQKLSRQANLDQIEPDAFDYVVIDEVHHADTRT